MKDERVMVVKGKFGFIYRILFLKKKNWKCVTMLPLLTLDSVDMSLCYSVLYVIVCFCNFKGELI